MPLEPWNILKLLKWTTAYLQSHHIDQPRADAEVLLAHALGLARVDLYIQYDRPLEPNELAVFKNFVQRRIHREPAAYIVGEKGFWSLDLKVTQDVLIPRPETEVLVEAALAIIPQETSPRPLRVLDLGTGSGAIGLALAMERVGHRFCALDQSKEALGIAIYNAAKHGIEGTITFVQSHWFDAFQDQQRTFDVIVSNPPYIRSSDFAMLAPEVSQYEPREALDGGPDGLDAIRLIVKEAPRYLTPGGWLLFEMGHDERASVENLIRACDAYTDLSVIKDYSRHDRVIRVKTKEKQIL
jgi:release factor glutamine methyltransferase